jgi:Caspase domain
MVLRVFSLIIGIDKYRSGSIWNLASCIDDARNVKNWLTDSLGVPPAHVCLLLNDKATKQSIEHHFMSHLLNNPAIEFGDAIIVYFAGHGSTVPAPVDWPVSNTGSVDILCTYDQDYRDVDRRIAGISDRSLHAMIDDLAQVKGSNITLIIDSCFSPIQSRLAVRDRWSTRWTPSKVSPDDLYSGLWRSALAKTSTYIGGNFFSAQYDSHVLLSACVRGGKATEGKEGGRFTLALLQATSILPLHETSYRELTRYLSVHMVDQRPGCFGYRKDSFIFDRLPFVPHASFVPLNVSNTMDEVRIEAGKIHGVVVGTEFSIHEHNFIGSNNPSLASFSAVEVHHTWCIAKPSKRTTLADNHNGSWAKVIKWNNTVPFRINLRRTCSSFLRALMQKKFPWSKRGLQLKEGLTVPQVKKGEEADITLHIRRREIVVQHHSISYPYTISFPNKINDSEVVGAAARFFHHLGRVNPDEPFRDRISMELFCLDPRTLEPVGKNFFIDGTAKLSENDGDIYAVHLHNHSDTDLWAHLAYMDTNGFIIRMLYRPDPSMASPPLKRCSRIIVGTGTPGSEAVKFPRERKTVAYLKLFVSSNPTCLDMIEQPTPQEMEKTRVRRGVTCQSEVWDTVVGIIVV